MQRRSNIQVSSLIIIFSILTILIQFATYHFLEASFIIWGISGLISIACCHILLEQTVSYEACFNYSFLTLFVSLSIIATSYFGNVQTFLPYTSTMLGIAVINWLIPMIHCFLRSMFEYGTRIDDFNEFYRNQSIVFFLFYMVILIYGFFAKGAFPWAYRAVTESSNFTPFEVITNQIEDYIYGLIPLSDVITYLLSRILAYVPYGFYLSLALRKQTRLPRFIALLSLPFIIEVLQYFIISERCDVDDIIYAFLGGVIGTILFFLTNVIFRAISGKYFLMKDNNHRFSSNSLHF